MRYSTDLSSLQASLMRIVEQDPVGYKDGNHYELQAKHHKVKYIANQTSEEGIKAILASLTGGISLLAPKESFIDLENSKSYHMNEHKKEMRTEQLFLKSHDGFNTSTYIPGLKKHFRVNVNSYEKDYSARFYVIDETTMQQTLLDRGI